MSELNQDSIFNSDFHSSVLTNKNTVSFINKADSIYLNIYNKSTKKDSDFALNIGTKVGTSFSNSFFSNHFVSPSINKKLNEKFSLIVGAKYSFSQFNNMDIFKTMQELQNYSGNIHSIGTYGSLIYKLNEKTNILTSIIVEQNHYTFENMQVINKTYNEMAFGINYNVTPSFSIGAQLNYGNRPYSTGMFSTNYFQTKPGFGF